MRFTITQRQEQGAYAGTAGISAAKPSMMQWRGTEMVTTFNSGMRSSLFSDWETPPWLFGLLDSIFEFKLDAAATAETAKCSRFFNPDDDALVLAWTPGPAFLNPPYGDLILSFIQKAAEQGRHETVVCLVPARTETEWFRIVWDKARYVAFLYRRVAFLKDGVPEKSPTFPNAIAVFSPQLWDLRALEGIGKVVNLPMSGDAVQNSWRRENSTPPPNSAN
jgi:phage N-6-adenine-methyltransferase